MRLGYIFGISLQAEVLILTICGILSSIFDISFLWMRTNLDRIWQIEMDPTTFTANAQYYIKCLSALMMVFRTYTIHIYLCCYIVMLYPVMYECRPRLIIPWLVVNAAKCLITGFIILLTNAYTCAMYWFKPPACWEFFLLHLINSAPSVYTFILVLTYYRDLRKLQHVHMYIDAAELRARRRFSQRRITDENRDTCLRPFDKPKAINRVTENQRVSRGTSVNNPGSSIEINCTEFRKMSSQDIHTKKENVSANLKMDKGSTTDEQQVVKMGTPRIKIVDESTAMDSGNASTMMINFDVYTNTRLPGGAVCPADISIGTASVPPQSSTLAMRNRKIKRVKSRNSSKSMLKKRHQKEERRVYKVSCASIQTQVNRSVESKAVCTHGDTEVKQLYKNNAYCQGNSSVFREDGHTQTHQGQYKSVVKFNLKTPGLDKEVGMDREVPNKPPTF